MALPIVVGVVLVALMGMVAVFGADSIWFGALAFSAQVLAVVVVVYGLSKLVRAGGRARLSLAPHRQGGARAVNRYEFLRISDLRNDFWTLGL